MIKLTAPQRRLLIEAGMSRRGFLKFLGKGAAVAANPAGAIEALGSLGSKAATVVSKFKGNTRNEIYTLLLQSLAGGSREHLTALANSYPYLDSSGNTKQYTPSDFLKDVSRYDFCIGGNEWDVADEWTNGGWSRLAAAWTNKVGVKQFFKILDEGQMWEGALFNDITGNVIDKIPEVQKVFSKFGVRNGNDWDKLKFNKKNEIFRKIGIPQQQEDWEEVRAREKNDLRGWARNTQFRFPDDFGEQPKDPRYPKELESPFESKLTAVQRNLLNESDYDFRQAERQAITGGADEKAKLLSRQLRVGQIARERVIFLSRLGYEPARVLYPEEEPLTFLNQFSDPMHVSTRAYSIANSATPDALRESGLEVEELVNFAADCAEEVLPIFNKAFPGDGRPAAAIAAARSGATTELAVAAAAEAGDDAEEAADVVDDDVAAWHDTQPSQEDVCGGCLEPLLPGSNWCQSCNEAVQQEVSDENSTEDWQQWSRITRAAALAAAYAADAAGAIHPNAAAHAVDQALIAGLDKSWANNRLIQYLLGEV